MRRHLERESFPRLQMLLIVSITGGIGFLASFGLLHAGVTQMWERYLYAFGISYLAFLLLLWVWMRTKTWDYTSVGDLANVVPSPGSTGSSGVNHAPFVGSGGTADGGGASANFESADVDGEAFSSSSGIASPGDALSVAADGDEFALPLVVIVMIAAILLSACWIVYTAPILFAELLVDGLLTAGLYRKMRGVAPGYWWLTAIKRTLLAFALTAAFFSAAGWLMQETYPEANSVGQFIHLRAQAKS